MKKLLTISIALLGVMERNKSYLNRYKELLLSSYVMDIKFFNKNLFLLINNKNTLEIRKYSADGKQLLAKKEFPLENEKTLKAQFYLKIQKRVKSAFMALKR